MGKSTKITIETESLLVLQGRKTERAWCPQCGEEAEMIPLNDVGVISNLLVAEVQEWLQSAELHRASAVNGESLICLKSMLNRVRKIG